MHLAIEALDETIDVASAPIAECRSHAVFRKGGVVRKRNRLPRGVVLYIWIEVVVGVDAVDVIAPDDIQDRAHRPVLNVRVARIHPYVASVNAHKIPALVKNVGVREVESVAGISRAER